MLLGVGAIPKDIRRTGVLVQGRVRQRRGGSSANTTALLVTADAGALGDGGEGGFFDMAAICIFCPSPGALFWGRGARKIKKRAKT